MAGRKTNSLLTVREAAELAHAHINTVRRWSNRGLIKAYRIGSRGDRRFRREEVIQFVYDVAANKDKDDA